MSDGDANFVASASIEETNAMRLKLGLKPLIEKETDVAIHAASSVAGSKKEIHKSARDELIAGEGLAEKISKRQRIATNRQLNNDEDEDIDTSDLMAWAQKMSRINAQKLKQREMAVSYSDDEDDEQQESVKENGKAPKAKPKLKVIHKIDELTANARGDEGVVLTLADVGVLEAEEAGFADVDFLENVEISAQKRHVMKQRMLKESQGEYIPFEDEQELNVNDDADAERNEGKRNILKHYDDKIDAISGKKLKNITTDGFFLDAENEANINDNDVHANNGVPMEPAEEQSVVLGSIKKRKFLDKRKDKKVDWNSVFGKEDSNVIHNGETEEADGDPSNDMDVNIKRLTKEAIVEDEHQEMDALYRQVARHRARYATVVKPECEEVVASVVDTGEPADDAASEAVEITPTSEFCNAVSISKSIAVDTLPRENGLIQPPNSPVDLCRRDPKEEVESEVYSEQPLSMGLAAALNMLREKGEIKSDAESKKRNLEDIGKDINLHYLDSYGRPMTPKEAFRHISWTFHGKGPGLNKQELKLKRLERERLVKADSVSNSVVMKALSSHQKQAKTPYLVLYGNSNK